MLPLPEFYVNRIVQYVVLCKAFFTQRIAFEIYTCYNFYQFFFFLEGRYFFVWTYHKLSFLLPKQILAFGCLTFIKWSPHPTPAAGWGKQTPGWKDRSSRRFWRVTAIVEARDKTVVALFWPQLKLFIYIISVNKHLVLRKFPSPGDNLFLLKEGQDW